MLRPVGPGGQQRYICVECGKHYTTSYNVRMHRNIHLGRNLYNCKFCHKEFSHKHVWEVREMSLWDYFSEEFNIVYSRHMSESIPVRGHSSVQLVPKILRTEVIIIPTRKSA